MPQPNFIDQIKELENRIYILERFGSNQQTQAWIAPTLTNSWVNFGTDGGGNWATAGYYKDNMGRVHVKGLIKNGTISTTLPAFTLPAGYRPLEQHIIVTQGNAAFAEIVLYTDGKVCAAVGNNAYFSIEFSFLAEQ